MMKSAEEKEQGGRKLDTDTYREEGPVKMRLEFRVIQPQAREGNAWSPWKLGEARTEPP